MGGTCIFTENTVTSYFSYFSMKRSFEAPCGGTFDKYLHHIFCGGRLKKKQYFLV